MGLKHNIFLPLPIRNNYPNLNNPEIKEIELSVVDGYGAAVEKSKNRIIIQWEYIIETKETGEELLYFGGRDINDIDGGAFNIKDFIKDSHDRFIQHFDKLALIDPLRPLEQTEIDQIHLDINAALFS